MIQWSYIYPVVSSTNCESSISEVSSCMKSQVLYILQKSSFGVAIFQLLLLGFGMCYHTSTFVLNATYLVLLIYGSDEELPVRVTVRQHHSICGRALCTKFTTILYAVDIKVCSNKACKNGGTCTYNAFNRYACLCADGYNGDNCTIGRSETHNGEASILEACSRVCLVEQCICLFHIQLYFIHSLTIFLIPSLTKKFIHIWLLGNKYVTNIAKARQFRRLSLS